ncbi:serine hydrolase domain-containing protein [Sphingobacterium suaedae]|uniref:Serine hydrolase domain-containing protein n=1 Tax=Sphingobacterium suaedae TaxID=1686402 RepID=A0ABW5KH55_9SPHI
MQNNIRVSVLHIFLILLCMTCRSQSFEQLSRSLNKLTLNSDAPGVAVQVAKNGRPIYTYFFGLADLERGSCIDKNTRFRMASVSKQVTARAILHLIDDGQLHMQSLLGDHLDGLPANLASIQIGQLLNHTSGVLDYEHVIPADQSRQLTDEDILNLMRQHGQVYFPPGSRFRYSNTGYCLLALVVAKISKQSFDDYIKEHLFLPRRIEHALVARPGSNILDRAYGYHPSATSFIFADQSTTSATQGDGGVYFSCTDFLLWCEHLLQQDWQNPSFQEAFFGNRVPVNDAAHYQLGLFSITDTNGHVHLFHSGESTGFNHIVYMNVHEHLTVNVFSNRDDPFVSDIFDLVMESLHTKELFDQHFGQSMFTWLNNVYQNIY